MRDFHGCDFHGVKIIFIILPWPLFFFCITIILYNGDSSVACEAIITPGPADAMEWFRGAAALR